jgi:two-component system sensor histidine kinase UhpB
MTTFVLGSVRQDATERSRGLGAIVSWALRAPLFVKIIGANSVVVVAGLGAGQIFSGAPNRMHAAVVLLLSLGVTVGMVWLALRPFASLQATADVVSNGNYSARVPASVMADRRIARLSATFNRLLDHVQADRARISYLAGRSVRARDIEREAVARELRDSLAQMVSGVALGIAAIRRLNIDPDVAKELEATSYLVGELSDQMRGVADTLYPGTLNEFGLTNALRARARIVSRSSGIEIAVDNGATYPPPSHAQATALYRVADEALRNVAQHSRANHARVLLTADSDGLHLVIEDDGRGIDVRANDPLQEGLGLFSAKTLLALSGGELQISGAPGRGTRVSARLPHQASPTGAWQAIS